MSASVRIIPTWLSKDGRIERSLAAAHIDSECWYLFAPQDARLHPRLSEILSAYALKRPDIDVFYSDEVIIGPDASNCESRLYKPSFDRTQIIAQDYIGLPVAVHGRALTKLCAGIEDSGTALTYELVLCALSEGIGIERIPEVLAVHQRGPSGNVDRAAALDRWIQRLPPGYKILPGMVDGTFQLCREFLSPPAVTVILSTRQRIPAMKFRARFGSPTVIGIFDCLAQTHWPMDRLSVLVTDDIADRMSCDGQTWPFQLQRVVAPHFSEITRDNAATMNQLWRRATDEHLIFMNEDLVIRNADWLIALMTFAANEEIGAVGARLLSQDNTIQHVGMAAGGMGSTMHVFRHRPASLPSYQNWAEVHREWSMVSGSVFATRRHVLQRVHGFDERFSCGLSEADLCLRLRMLGYRVVYTPFAEFTHNEGDDGGEMSISAEEIALFAQRWQHFLRDDPAYHPGLSTDPHEAEPLPKGDEWWLGPTPQPKIVSAYMPENYRGR